MCVVCERISYRLNFPPVEFPVKTVNFEFSDSSTPTAGGGPTHFTSQNELSRWLISFADGWGESIKRWTFTLPLNPEGCIYITGT